MQHKGRLATRADLLALFAVVIGEKDESVIFNLTQQNHAHIGQALRVYRGQGNRIRIVEFAFLSLLHPCARNG